VIAHRVGTYGEEVFLANAVGWIDNENADRYIRLFGTEG
jgi:hypothetical protein